MAQNQKLKDFLQPGVPLCVDTNYVKQGENANGVYYMYGGKIDGKEFVHFASQSQHGKIQKYPAEKRGDGKTYHVGVRVILDSENKMQVYDYVPHQIPPNTQPTSQPVNSAAPAVYHAPVPAALPQNSQPTATASTPDLQPNLQLIGGTMKAILESLAPYKDLLGANLASVANTVFIEVSKRDAWVAYSPKHEADVAPQPPTPPPAVTVAHNSYKPIADALPF